MLLMVEAVSSQDVDVYNNNNVLFHEDWKFFCFTIHSLDWILIQGENARINKMLSTGVKLEPTTSENFCFIFGLGTY